MASYDYKAFILYIREHYKFIYEKTLNDAENQEAYNTFVSTVDFQFNFTKKLNFQIVDLSPVFPDYSLDMNPIRLKKEYNEWKNGKVKKMPDYVMIHLFGRAFTSVFSLGRHSLRDKFIIITNKNISRSILNIMNTYNCVQTRTQINKTLSSPNCEFCENYINNVITIYEKIIMILSAFNRNQLNNFINVTEAYELFQTAVKNQYEHARIHKWTRAQHIPLLCNSMLVEYEQLNEFIPFNRSIRHLMSIFNLGTHSEFSKFINSDFIIETLYHITVYKKNIPPVIEYLIRVNNQNNVIVID